MNGPEPTGFGFVNVDGSATCDQMCRGITIAPFSVAAMNCESAVFRLMTTAYVPFALIEAMFVSGRVYPMMSITLFCLPAVRLYTTSTEVSGLPSDHLTPFASCSVSVLLPLLHFQLVASHGSVGFPPSGETMSPS